jgi:glycosyltransferase involved in cell wall biosynthesis
MKIAIMMRAIDQDTGFRVYIERLVDSMLQMDSQNAYLLLYRSNKWLGRFSKLDNVKEVLLRVNNKFIWDQIAVPYRAWKEHADIIFNPKFSVPLVSHCPVAMGLQEPSWWAWPDHHAWWDVRYMRTMLPLYCRRAAHIFPMSKFILDENRKYLGLPLENTTVTYTANNVHFQPIDDSAILEAFRNEHALPEKFILSVTRVENIGNNKTSFCATKNVETTVRAYALCRASIPHQLVIAGRRVREYLLHMGWSNAALEGIRFLDFVPHEDMHKLYNLADLFLLPSFYEGCPHTLIEAMSCGCPIIASQTGPCPEISSGAAILADPNEPADFAAKIMSIVNKDDLRQELREKSLQRAAAFNWERTARLTLTELTRAVETSRR